MPTDPLRPHDLLRLSRPRALLTGADPAWVGAALAAAPWAVVRRRRAAPGHVAVGVRGARRSERHAASTPVVNVADTVRPEDLCRLADTLEPRTPALSALRRVAPVLDGLGCPWGPTGGVGFELATGLAVTTRDSDLDLVLRPRTPPTPAWAADVAERLSSPAVRVDCLLETAAGAVALAELAAAPDHLALRTDQGPRLAPLAEVAG
ncbi:malonate decarboxylase holo-ACP synthase [Streptomyces sp. NPDC046985]|uniref:malonate decarboxylase holo-ACP synthase n=1 Tax=Streptomyces sp. NPDC046985 TaxID=3155377 RepID=UPI0033E886A5